jgi:hypothetical protein
LKRKKHETAIFTGQKNKNIPTQIHERHRKVDGALSVKGDGEISDGKVGALRTNLIACFYLICHRVSVERHRRQQTLKKAAAVIT